MAQREAWDQLGEGCCEEKKRTPQTRVGRRAPRQMKSGFHPLNRGIKGGRTLSLSTQNPWLMGEGGARLLQLKGEDSKRKKRGEKRRIWSPPPYARVQASREPTRYGRGSKDRDWRGNHVLKQGHKGVKTTGDNPLNDRCSKNRYH